MLIPHCFWGRNDKIQETASGCTHFGLFIKFRVTNPAIWWGNLIKHILNYREYVQRKK